MVLIPTKQGVLLFSKKEDLVWPQSVQPTNYFIYELWTDSNQTKTGTARFTVHAQQQ